MYSVVSVVQALLCRFGRCGGAHYIRFSFREYVYRSLKAFPVSRRELCDSIGAHIPPQVLILGFLHKILGITLFRSRGNYSSGEQTHNRSYDSDGNCGSAVNAATDQGSA